MTPAAKPSAGDATGARFGRLESLDALRGFDMLWIVGADAIGSALAKFQGGPVTRFLATQLDHVEWEGFHFYDLIFPLFVFMTGVAIPFSLDRMVQQEGRPAAVRRVLRRGLLLCALGLFYYGGMAQGFAHIRLMGVLQRIGVCYVAASLLYLYFKPRVVIATGAALLVLYWALMTFVPVPGFGAGDFALRHNLANWIDARFLPLRMWDGDTDPEGLLSTLPAISSCILGLTAGLQLRATGKTAGQKVRWLALAGIALVILGYLWGGQFPVIKRLWTSSFVCVAGGWSLLLLALFYYLIDVRGWRGWSRPFVWVGCNALTIYLVSLLVSVDNVSERLLGGEIAAGLNALWPGLGGLVLALTGIALCFLVCRFLYVRNIFLRL